jgi:hypothetical protein
MLELEHQLNRFATFYQEFKDKRYIYTPSHKCSKSTWWGDSTYWSDGQTVKRWNGSTLEVVEDEDTPGIWKGGRLDLTDIRTLEEAKDCDDSGDDLYLQRYGLVPRDRYEF